MTSRLAVGETFILMAPPSPSLLKHLVKGERGVQQNDSLADGYSRRTTDESISSRSTAAGTTRVNDPSIGSMLNVRNSTLS